jgi:hypothetical protein
MALVRDQPLLTEAVQVSAFRPEAGSAYLFGRSGEERSEHASEWDRRVDRVEFIRITVQEGAYFEFEKNAISERVALRSRDQLEKFWNSISSETLYLDITGLSHHVWAPLLRIGLSSRRRRVVGMYVEPGDYRPSPTPTEGEIFDLSERILGISPIPGFASLSDSGDENVCFVPLLGFEGARFAYLLEQVQPPGGKIVPVVGVPGFRVEYPFHTYLGNRSWLAETRAWRNVKFARANCPFSLFYLLQEIAAEHPQDTLKIAPSGTKPHALGAVLYAMASPRSVELVYDHPIRKPTRTTGTARLLLYHLSSFPLASPHEA